MRGALPKCLRLIESYLSGIYLFVWHSLTFLIFPPPRFTIKTSDQILKAIALGCEVPGMELEFGGGEAGFWDMGFAYQSALLVHAQTVHSAVSVFQRGTEGRGRVGVTRGVPDH